MNMEKKYIYYALFVTGISSLTVFGCYLYKKLCSKNIQLSHIGYYLYNKFFSKNIQLSQFLEEYFLEAETKLQNEPTLSKNTVAFIINLFFELEDFIFITENRDLETERVDLLSKNLSEEYEKSLKTTIQMHEESTAKATQLLEQRLKISMDIMQQKYSKFDKKEISELMRKNRKKYYHLCDNSEDSEYKKEMLNKKKVKDAYLEWGRINKERDETSKKLFLFSTQNQNFEAFALQLFMLNKYFVKDKIYTKYGIKSKHFNDLLTEFQLDDDKEVKEMKEELDNLLFG